MRKITFLVLCFIATLGTVNAQNIEDLLNRLAVEAENNLGQEPTNLFTADEKQLLQEYFNDNNPANPTENLAIGDVYALQLYGGCDPRGLGRFPLAGPYSLNMISSTTTMFYAGDQDGSGNLYGLAVEGYVDEIITLVKIDSETGEETTIDTLDFFPTGLSWNNANSTMYALGLYAQETSLFTIDLETGETTLIGETGNSLGIWLAIDNSGNAFMVDIGIDYFFSIDLETGAGTVIGPIGVDLSFAQDADFDPVSGILYTVGYHGGGVNRLYSVNTNTGEYTSLGPVNNDCAQIGIVSIEGQPPVIISENSLEGFSFYPNPPADILNLKSDKTINTVCIYDLLGQQIIKSHINSTNSQIDVSALKAGTYIMKVDVNGQTGSYKLIKN